MKDIVTREDLELLMNDFYSKLLNDVQIGYIFTEVAQINLKKHLPVLVDFWEQTLFYRGGYKNNVLQIHKDLNEKTALNAGHFQIWLAYFNKTVDENFKGEFAEKIKVKALSIATVMQLKIEVKPE